MEQPKVNPNLKPEKLIANQDKLSSIAQRLKAPTPAFWKKIRYISMFIGATSIAILGAPVALAVLNITFVLPHFYEVIATHGIVIGCVGTGLSKLPVDWDTIKLK